jgi:hypothetical protein
MYLDEKFVNFVHINIRLTHSSVQSVMKQGNTMSP